jgi:hypothetical protein
MRIVGAILLAVMSFALAGCATQQAMTVEATAIPNPVAKYRNAVAVRAVTGGAAMNVMTVPGVTDEPFKAALEASLAASGYLARTGTPKYYLDVEIGNLDQPLIGLDLDVTSHVTYKVSGAASATYPISAKGSASFSDSPIAVDRMRIANERAMQENIKAFLLKLR